MPWGYEDSPVPRVRQDDEEERENPADRTRWRCKDRDCGVSSTSPYERRAMDLETSLRWLFSKESQAERKVPARTLRRMNELMWGLWPPVPLVGEVYDVVHLDGIHLHRDAVVPVAIASGHAVGWYVAGNETSAAWGRLMARISPPLAVVVDGGGGVLKALRTYWPDTRVQRCLFHVCMNITALTGLKPRLEAGKQLKGDSRHAQPGHGRGFGGRVAGRLQPVGTTTRRVPGREKHLRGRQHSQPAPAPRQGQAHDPKAHPGGTPVRVRRAARRMRTGDTGDEQPHRITKRAHPRHAAPPPRPQACYAGSRRSAGGATNTANTPNRPAGWPPTRPPANKSNNSTGKPGNTARRARTKHSASPTDTAPASTGTNSTPAHDTQTPPNNTPPQTHILAYNLNV